MTEEYERYSFWHTEIKVHSKKDNAALPQMDLDLIETDTKTLELINDDQAIYI